MSTVVLGTTMWLWAVEPAPTPTPVPAVEPVPAETVPTPAPVAVVVPEPRAELTPEERQRLQAFRFQNLAVESTGDGSFRVKDGLGASLGVATFAKTTGDSQTLDVLADDRERARTHKKVLTYSGIGLIGISALTLAVGLPNETDEGREDLAYTGVFLGLSGGLLWWVAPMAAKAQENPALDDYYTRTQAESRTESFNDTLRAQLDVDDLQAIERLESEKAEAAKAEAANAEVLKTEAVKDERSTP